MTTNQPIQFLAQAVVTYTKLTGEVATFTVTDPSAANAKTRALAAIAKAKAANPTHEMREKVEIILPLKEKKMTRAEYRSELGQKTYFAKHSPECGRALGYK